MTDEILKAIDLYFVDQYKRNKWELKERSKEKYLQLELFRFSNTKDSTQTEACLISETSLACQLPVLAQGL